MQTELSVQVRGAPCTGGSGRHNGPQASVEVAVVLWKCSSTSCTYLDLQSTQHKGPCQFAMKAVFCWYFGGTGNPLGMIVPRLYWLEEPSLL